LGKAKKLDFLIALGTHPSLTELGINKHLGITFVERKTKFKNIGIFNHNWTKNLRQIGTISQNEVEALFKGLLSEDIPITINKRIFDYEHLIILGPVFPYEVVGFSGGYKYFFLELGDFLISSKIWRNILRYAMKKGVKRLKIEQLDRK
jgi:Uncharacterized conserved protein